MWCQTLNKLFGCVDYTSVKVPIAKVGQIVDDVIFTEESLSKMDQDNLEYDPATKTLYWVGLVYGKTK